MRCRPGFCEYVGRGSGSCADSGDAADDQMTASLVADWLLNLTITPLLAPLVCLNSRKGNISSIKPFISCCSQNCQTAINWLISRVLARLTNELEHR